MAANVAADKPSMVPTQLESIDRKLDRIEEGIDMLDNEIQARCRPPELKFPAPPK